MPPILTYSFLPGLVGSWASVQVSKSILISEAARLTNVIRPFELHRHALVPLVVRLNALRNRNCCEILYEDNWSGVAE